MRIALKGHIDFESITNDLRFDSSDREQLIELFNKIRTKKHLGTGGSSRLDCLLSIINYANLELISSDVGFYYFLQQKNETNEKKNIYKPAYINIRNNNFKTKLQQAIINYKENSNSCRQIKNLLKNTNLDINLTDKDGRTALYQSIQILKPKILKMILAVSNLNINSRNLIGTTPLIRAAKRNNYRAVELLLEHGAKIDVNNHVGTALTYAARKGHEEIVKLLLQKNANLDAVGYLHRKTPLEWAKENNHQNIIKALEDADAERVSFTVCSYNCGGYIKHYDYLRTACLQEIMRRRFESEPDLMDLIFKIETLALKKLLSTDPKEKKLAENEWVHNNYEKTIDDIAGPIHSLLSPNNFWNKESNRMITPYNQKPTFIYDKDVLEKINKQIQNVTKENRILNFYEALDATRRIMMQQTIQDFLPYDILCLQEVEYIDPSMFPDKYNVLLNKTSHTGIAWDKSRFTKATEHHLDKCTVVQLIDNQTNKIIAVASGHIYGCNPFKVEMNSKTNKTDSPKGDRQLRQILNYLNSKTSNIEILGIDSNVTAMHPRLKILKDENFKIDYRKFIGPTCTNPVHLLNTRIDWIALRFSPLHCSSASINNLPVELELNNINTNASDHVPIASVVKYKAL